MRTSEAEVVIMKPWFIRDTDFTRVVSEEDRATFMRVCPDRRYQKGDTIFRMGDPATDMHVIAEGQVKLVSPTASGQERILAICGPFNFIGEAFLLEESHYRVDAVALTDVTTCPMSREQFLQLSVTAPTFALSFAEILASHLFHCRQQLSDGYDPIKFRVVKVLIEQAHRFGEQVGDTDWCELRTELKHEEIASIISGTRVAVTMAFSELREEGLVEGSRGSYRLYMPGLVALAEH
ncbi:MAG: Crp/Fnr family transcriptional regulator [Deinococcota bacterium]|jgi:CRP-like cAMP-binding protein|nr:Crp/Fnr family transcriptional regulator [Deinococcota bacterium]